MTAMPEVLREDTLNIPDSRGLNLYTCDPALERLLEVYLPPALLAEWRPLLERLGARAGGELDVLALAADKNPPVLAPRTRRGEDLQSIRKHPDYVALERVAYAELGLASMSHRPDGPPPLVKYALTHLFVQAEFGLCCPVSMTDSLTRTLRRFGAPELVERYLPSLASRDFDELFQGAMFMTEQAAGSDVARTRTVAREEGGEWKLYGDKWFCSNPDADLAMVLARPEGAPEGMKGVTLFLLPKVREDGTRNAYRIVRLKDKLGSRSMASGEVRLEGASAYLIGEIGRGFQQMADMVNMSRLSNGVRAAGLMRRALSEALFVARHRRAFGKHLIDMPLMQKQLLKMMLPTEQARFDVHADRHAAAARRWRRGRGAEMRADPHPADQVPRLPRCASGHRRRHGGARRGRLHRVERPAAGARRPPGVDLGGHQQHRGAGRRPCGEPRTGARILAAPPAPAAG